MKRTMTAISALAALGLAGAAFAGESTGTVQAVDSPSRTIVLDDGNNYVVADGIQIEVLQPGVEVKVVFEEQGGQKVITEIQPAS